MQPPAWLTHASSISLTRIGRPNIEKPGTFTTQFIACDPDTIALRHPEATAPEQSAPKFVVGDALDVAVATPTGSYIFRTTVVRARHPDELVVKRPKDMDAIRPTQQRREARLEARLPLNFIVSDRVGLVTYRCATLDVSAAGARVELVASGSVARPQVRTIGKVELTLSDYGSLEVGALMKCMARVVKVSSQHPREFVVDFTNMAESERSKVARFVLQRQVGARRNTSEEP